MSLFEVETTRRKAAGMNVQFITLRDLLCCSPGTSRLSCLCIGGDTGEYELWVCAPLRVCICVIQGVGSTDGTFDICVRCRVGAADLDTGDSVIHI